MKFKPSPSLIVATAAVVIASAGSATAATMITGQQIRNGTITAADIRNGTIGKRDLKAGAVSSNAIRTGAVTAADIEPGTVQELQATLATTKVSRSEPIVYANGDWSPKSIDVACPDGQIAVGGGGGFSEVPHAGQVGLSRPVLDAQSVARGWQVAGSPGVADNRTLEVYAICAI